MFKFKDNQTILRSELKACATKSIGEAASALASFLLNKSEETLNKIDSILAGQPNLRTKFFASNDLNLNEEYIKASFEILILRWASLVIYVFFTLSSTSDEQDPISASFDMKILDNYIENGRTKKGYVLQSLMNENRCNSQIDSKNNEKPMDKNDSNSNLKKTKSGEVVQKPKSETSIATGNSKSNKQPELNKSRNILSIFRKKKFFKSKIQDKTDTI